FITAFGNDEGGEATTFNGTIPQALMMMNGDLIKKATDYSQGSFLNTIVTSSLGAQQQIDDLAMAALSRPANRSEITVANELLALRRAEKPSGGNNSGAWDPRLTAIQDLWWVYLNSNEFI